MWRLIDLFDNIPAHPAEMLSVFAFQKLEEIRGRSKGLTENNRAIYREFCLKSPLMAYLPLPWPAHPRYAADDWRAG